MLIKLYSQPTEQQVGSDKKMGQSKSMCKVLDLNIKIWINHDT